VIAMQKNIHITGAAGSGVTTLGRALSRVLGSTLLDIDDYFWLPTESPYTIKRPREQRLVLLHEAFARASDTGWVLSGSILEWGDSLIPLFDLTILFQRRPSCACDVFKRAKQPASALRLLHQAGQDMKYMRRL
jgi:adenylate kinase family enzyme